MLEMTREEIDEYIAYLDSRAETWYSEESEDPEKKNAEDATPGAVPF